MGSIATLSSAPQLSTMPGADWNTFFDVVRKAFTAQLQQMSWPDSQKPVYVEDFPGPFPFLTDPDYPGAS